MFLPGRSRYHFWRVTFWQIWAGAVFTAGWATRAASSYHPNNLSLFIAQTILIYCAPPIYAATEYNILGRLMQYLPMHAPLNPNRVIYFFVYLGTIVESLNGAGAGRMAAAGVVPSLLKSGAGLVFGAVILQAVVEYMFMCMVALMHYRASKAHMCTPNVRKICIMLYGTSLLVLLRCIFRAIEAYNIFNIYANPDKPCEGMCRSLIVQEWHIYAFEAAPMVIYTLWLNIMHPGRYLPSNKNRFLGFDCDERLGPGWIDRRPKMKTYLDPFDVEGLMKGQADHDKFWEQEWPIPSDGEFSKGTASNARRGKHQ